jgi:Zn ribbon nucleic-acid-binding protein
MLIALRRRARETASRAAESLSRKITNQKSYPSQRPCPVCDGKTVYQASWGTFFNGLYTRTCLACGYRDSRKVKMIHQL